MNHFQQWHHTLTDYCEGTCSVSESIFRLSNRIVIRPGTFEPDEPGRGDMFPAQVRPRDRLSETNLLSREDTLYDREGMAL